MTKENGEVAGVNDRRLSEIVCICLMAYSRRIRRRIESIDILENQFEEGDVTIAILGQDGSSAMFEIRDGLLLTSANGEITISLVERQQKLI